MRNSPLIMAALLVLAACATAPAPEPAPEETSSQAEGYGALIERAADALAAAEPPGAVPAGLQITVLSVDETEAGLFYNAELHVASGRRRDQDYIIYGQCPVSDIPACAGQIVAGARMLTKPGAD